MNCRDISAQIEAWFDGAANPVFKDEIEAHLLACALCNNRLARLRAMRDLLQRDNIPPPSISLDMQVMSAFRDRFSRPRIQSPGWRSLVLGSVLVPKPAIAMALLAVVAALLIGVLIGELRGERTANQAVPRELPLLAAPSTTAPSTKIPEAGLQPGEKTRAQTKAPRYRSGERELQTVRSGSVARNSPANSLESSTTVSPLGANYSTKALLGGFEPVRESRIRVLKSEEQR
jgi:hypothetical protein